MENEGDKTDLWIKRKDSTVTDAVKDSKDCYFIEGYIQASNSLSFSGK